MLGQAEVDVVLTAALRAADCLVELPPNSWKLPDDCGENIFQALADRNLPFLDSKFQGVLTTLAQWLDAHPQTTQLPRDIYPDDLESTVMVGGVLSAIAVHNPQKLACFYHVYFEDLTCEVITADEFSAHKLLKPIQEIKVKFELRRSDGVENHS